MTFTFIPARSRRRGFSLTELAVVIVILGILASIFIPYFGKIRETDRRVRCEDNLRAIMGGLRQYAMLKNSKGKEIHVFPSVIHDRKQSGYTAYTGADSPDPFAKSTRVKPNDVTASLWLLVRYGFVGAGRFICPSSKQSPDPMLNGSAPVAASQRSNFTDGTHLSYSYASPFSTAKGYNLSEDSHVGDFALLADKNPGISGKESNVTAPAWDSPPFELARANSRNHGHVGQNVLYADGHVDWKTTAYCGYEDPKTGRRDNIFTALNAVLPIEANGVCGREYGPSWANDSYLVPTEGE
jgi:prepilin-type N-terminal cleavage/methylation domain-containing protein/prepilin-type processing-associated H-X9-DG protein